MHLVIADRHTLYREALCAYLQQAAGPVTSVQTVGDYAALIDRLSGMDGAGMVLLDPELPGLPAMDDYREMMLAHAPLSIALMREEAAAMHDPSALYPVFSRDMPGKAFLKGVRQLLRGEAFDPDISVWRGGAGSLPDPAPPCAASRPVTSPLTTRERQVLSFLMEGASNKDIARALDLQVVTVKLHVRGICRKTGAKNRTQAALFAKANNWDIQGLGKC